jgi:long-chain acyl-CoA synthetase
MVENPKAMHGLQTALAATPDPKPDLQWILLTGSAEGAITLDQLIEKGQRQLAADPHSFERIRACFDDQALAVLYMTSGATGEPKMGLVTHAALVINIDMTPAVLPLTPDDCTVAFLPSAHIAQRVVGELMPLRTGSCVWFSEGLSKLPNELRTARPTFFLSPPRVWERMYSSILAEIKKRPAPLAQNVLSRAWHGLPRRQLRRDGRPVPAWMRSSLGLFDKIIFNKIRERLGGRLRFPHSGAAPLSKDLAEFYEAIGMPLLEGYGLTEGGVVSVNPHRSRPKPGSIGKLLPGIEVRASKKTANCCCAAPLISPAITKTLRPPLPSCATAGSHRRHRHLRRTKAITTSPAARRS